MHFLQRTEFTNAKMLKKANSNNGNDVWDEICAAVVVLELFVSVSIILLSMDGLEHCLGLAGVFEFSSVFGELFESLGLWSVCVAVSSSLVFKSSANCSKYSSISSTVWSVICSTFAAGDEFRLVCRFSANCFSYISSSCKSISMPFIQNGFE